MKKHAGEGLRSLEFFLQQINHSGELHSFGKIFSLIGSVMNVKNLLLFFMIAFKTYIHAFRATFLSM